MPVREFHATKLNREESPMSDTNIAVVKKIYECFDAGDISGLLELDLSYKKAGRYPRLTRSDSN